MCACVAVCVCVCEDSHFAHLVFFCSFLQLLDKKKRIVKKGVANDEKVESSASAPKKVCCVVCMSLCCNVCVCVCV